MVTQTESSEKVHSPHRAPFIRKVPLWIWIVVIALYALPAIFAPRFLMPTGMFIVQTLWQHTVLLVPGLLLCYYLGFIGALLANLLLIPVLWQVWLMFGEQQEYLLILFSHLFLLMISLLLIGLMAEQLKRQEEKMKKLSITDELTALYNHRFFYFSLEKEVEQARRYKTPLTLVIMDLDDFKKYNDTWGHIQGDRALATAAALIKATVRVTDTVARYGGEEFAVILSHTELVSAKKICERIREVLAETPIPAEQGVTDPLTASFGVVTLDNSMTAGQLVSEADRILYYAKSCGKNLVTCR
jgi:diguanylate cyclase (GGDEF)-like protein